jgi:hypothetical protein
VHAGTNAPANCGDASTAVVLFRGRAGVSIVFAPQGTITHAFKVLDRIRRPASQGAHRRWLPGICIASHSQVVTCADHVIFRHLACINCCWKPPERLDERTWSVDYTKCFWPWHIWIQAVNVQAGRVVDICDDTYGCGYHSLGNWNIASHTLEV